MKRYNDGDNACTDQGGRNSSSAGQFKVIVKLAYSRETDEALFDNPHARAPLKVSVEDKIKTVNPYNAIEGTLGKPIQVVFTFKKREIRVGQTFTACVQDLDRSITPPPNKDCKTGFNSFEKKPAIVDFDIG